MINGAYNDYWQLRDIAFADGHTYNISTLGAQMIAAQLAAKLGADASTITTTQIQAEATTRFIKDKYLLGPSLPLNVSGRQVMLYAPNGNIGSLATPETFTFRSDDASNLTATQEAVADVGGSGPVDRRR